MFKSVFIQNFRGINKLEISDLDKINIFVGDNATGKTAVLDAIYILINPNNPELPLKTNDWRNLGPFFTSSFWRSLFYKFDYKNEILLKAKNGVVTRELIIKPKISVETMVVVDDKTNGELKASSELEKPVNGVELHFKIGNKSYVSEIEQKSIREAKLNIDQKYQEKMQGNYFNNKTYANEIDLATKFDVVNQEVGKEVIIDFLKSFIPSIDDIELDRFRKLIVKDASFRKRIHLNTYGDGVVRGLHIVLDVLAKGNGITLIDEVENGLHWSKQEILWRFLHKIILERNQQLFVTTHSREMVDHLYKAGKKEGFLQLVRLYRLQVVNKEDIKLVQYKSKELEFAITHGEEFR